MLEIAVFDSHNNQTSFEMDRDRFLNSSHLIILKAIVLLHHDHYIYFSPCCITWSEV